MCAVASLTKDDPLNWVSEDLPQGPTDCWGRWLLEWFVPTWIHQEYITGDGVLPLLKGSASASRFNREQLLCANAETSRDSAWCANRRVSYSTRSGQKWSCIKWVYGAALRLCKYREQTNTKWLPELFWAFQVNTIFLAYHRSLAYMKLSNDPGRPKAVHLFMFMFYWCEQRELCPRKVNQSFFFQIGSQPPRSWV